MDRLKGKVAVSRPGGSSGIGRATSARLFAAEGAFVFITGRRQVELDSAVAEIGANAIGIRGDIADLADLDRLFDRIKTDKGRIDILFANAGLGDLVPLGAITEAHFDKTFDVNVKGTLFTVQKALPLMPKGSSIVLNGSMVSIKGMAAFGVYAAKRKPRCVLTARTWIVDLKDRQIRVNVVSPGTIPTPGYDQLGLTEEQMTGFMASQAAVIPLGRVGVPDEIAKAVLFLASDRAASSMGASCSSMVAWPRFEPSKPNAAGVGHSRKRKMLGKLNLQGGRGSAVVGWRCRRRLHTGCLRQASVLGPQPRSLRVKRSLYGAFISLNISGLLFLCDM